MKTPHAVLIGASLIAGSILITQGGPPVGAQTGVQRVAICDTDGQRCATIGDVNKKKKGSEAIPALLVVDIHRAKIK